MGQIVYYSRVELPGHDIELSRLSAEGETSKRNEVLNYSFSIFSMNNFSHVFLTLPFTNELAGMFIIIRT